MPVSTGGCCRSAPHTRSAWRQEAAQVRKHLFTPFRDSFTIDVPGPDDLEMRAACWITIHDPARRPGSGDGLEGLADVARHVRRGYCVGRGRRVDPGERAGARPGDGSGARAGPLVSPLAGAAWTIVDGRPAYFFGPVSDGGGSGTLIPVWAVGTTSGVTMAARPIAMAASVSAKRRADQIPQGLLQSRALVHIARNPHGVVRPVRILTRFGSLPRRPGRRTPEIDMGILDLFGTHRYDDPVVGPLKRGWGSWRGQIALGDGEPVPLMLAGWRSAPDPTRLRLAHEPRDSVRGVTAGHCAGPVRALRAVRRGGISRRGAGGR